MIFERIKKVDEIISSIHEMIPNVKTVVDNTNGIIEALPTKRQLGLRLGLRVLRIGLVVGLAIWLSNDKKANNEVNARNEKKANKDEKCHEMTFSESSFRVASHLIASRTS
ncbi:hypothetical protein ACE6H2_010066 [Prunus campanulata]